MNGRRKKIPLCDDITSNIESFVIDPNQKAGTEDYPIDIVALSLANRPL